MFTWVGNQFDVVLDTYVLGVVTTLMTAIAPIALTSLTLWVGIYGWAVLRNEVPETVPSFLWKVFTGQPLPPWWERRRLQAHRRRAHSRGLDSSSS